ncbi:hypothetical protein FZEAL_8970 [Fusarium zealandicum]|uniref:DUF6536 domain-containing protein n=1 Tax=Fusarium zealandicum TaxID=1053134 RepID=A0A8H4XGC7_9HYPO|nr:hypothetical protein FZEAL_8970 [Fusarium zealandicum]
METLHVSQADAPLASDVDEAGLGEDGGNEDELLEQAADEREQLLPSTNNPPRHFTDTRDSRSDRYAKAAFLSRYIPELDPDSARATTIRVKMAKRSAMLLMQMGIAILAVTIICSGMTWAILTYPPDERGIGTFFFGSCSSTSTINTAAHAGLNVVSSLFLGAGNYCMQILVAPSREEIDTAHRKGKVTEIGVPSLKNFRHIEKKRTTVWLIIGLVATTLHVLIIDFSWNSTIFASLPVAIIPRAIVTSDFQTASDNWKASDPLPKLPWWELPPAEQREAMNLSTVYSLQSQATSFTHLSKPECIKQFVNPLESTRSLVVVAKNVSSLQNNGSSILDGWTSGWGHGWELSSAWICTEHQISLQDWRYCTWEFGQTFSDNWTVEWSNSGFPPILVDHCLVGEAGNNKERCGLHYSTYVLGIHRQNARTKDVEKRRKTMVTMGDAIHSFLETPHADIAQGDEKSPRKEGVRVCVVEWLAESRVSWAKTISPRAWAAAFLLFTISMGVCIYSITSSFTHLQRLGIDSAVLWQRGFGVHPVMTASSLGPLSKLIKSPTAAMLSNILVANSPQVLVSFLYIFYNNILTRQLVADEWVGFLREDGKKVLRVSSPAGMQRSSYFLSLPLKYSVPLMVLSITLHWLISQSLFLVQSCAFSPGKDGERLPHFDHSTRGYSMLGSTLAVGLAFIMVVALALNSTLRYYHNIPAGFQLMAFNSLALKAVCQRPDGDTDARYFPVRIGVVPDMEDAGADHAPRIVFSTDTELYEPENGCRYLQPVFIEGGGGWHKLTNAIRQTISRCFLSVTEFWDLHSPMAERRQKAFSSHVSEGHLGSVDESEMELTEPFRPQIETSQCKYYALACIVSESANGL